MKQAEFISYCLSDVSNLCFISNMICVMCHSHFFPLLDWVFGLLSLIMGLWVSLLLGSPERLPYKPEGYSFWTWRGHRIHYVERGEGTPIVLIHGFGASAFHWRFVLFNFFYLCKYRFYTTAVQWELYSICLLPLLAAVSRLCHFIIFFQFFIGGELLFWVRFTDTTYQSWQKRTRFMQLIC